MCYLGNSRFYHLRITLAWIITIFGNPEVALTLTRTSKDPSIIDELFSEMASWKKRTRSATAAPSDGPLHNKRRKSQDQFQRGDGEQSPPKVQSALLLHAIRQPYEPANDHPVPAARHDSEMLVKVEAIGLNPIDWKAPYVLCFALKNLSLCKRRPCVLLLICEK